MSTRERRHAAETEPVKQAYLVAAEEAKARIAATGTARLNKGALQALVDGRNVLLPRRHNLDVSRRLKVRQGAPQKVGDLRAGEAEEAEERWVHGPHQRKSGRDG